MITFKLREEEFLEGSSLVALWPPKQIVSIILFSSTLFIIGCSFAFSKETSPEFVLIGPVFFCLSLIAPLSIAFGRPIAFRRKFLQIFKTRIEPLSPDSISWDSSKLIFERASKTTSKSWQDFARWQQTALLLVLYEQGPKVKFAMLPKRAFVDEGDLRNFVELLAKNVGEER